MAAVELVENEEFHGAHARPQLRLVTFESSPQPLRTGPSLARRRAKRALMLRRRRRTLVALALLAGLTILALPGVAFGGVSSSGLSSDLNNNAALAPGMVFVVQSGDSINTIASLVNPADPSKARAQLVHELDSTVVVRGEHVLIP
jgi:hypothetical protein